MSNRINDKSNRINFYFYFADAGSSTALRQAQPFDRLRMTALRQAQGDKLNVMEKVISFLNNLHPLSGSLEAELRNAFRFTRKKKNDFLIYEGEVCHYAWYLQKGLVRCYYDRDEHEVTTWFMEEDHVIVLFESLFRQKKSIFNIQALEDCELYGIRYEDILHVLETYPEARYIHTIISDRYSNLKDIRIRATSMLGPKERYRYFQKHFPQLLSRVKLEYIASYLDMDVRTLTRARKPE